MFAEMYNLMSRHRAEEFRRAEQFRRAAAGDNLRHHFSRRRGIGPIADRRPFRAAAARERSPARH